MPMRRPKTRKAAKREASGACVPSRQVTLCQALSGEGLRQLLGRTRLVLGIATHERWRTPAAAPRLGWQRRLSGILCARHVSSLADEPFAEDDGELHLSFEPLARRSFPFLGRVVQDQI